MKRLILAKKKRKLRKLRKHKLLKKQLQAINRIYMTILLYPDIPPVKAPQLTLLMAIAVAEGIQEVTGLETKIKWPNDIVVNGRKI